MHVPFKSSGPVNSADFRSTRKHIWDGGWRERKPDYVPQPLCRVLSDGLRVPIREKVGVSKPLGWQNTMGYYRPRKARKA